VVAVAAAVVVADAAAVGAIAVHATNVKALENFKGRPSGLPFFAQAKSHETVTRLRGFSLAE
jgi:hypothetical protein